MSVYRNKRMTTHGLEIVAVADPAGGRPTSNGARSSIVVLGRDPDTDFRFVLEAWAERCYTDRLTDQIFALNRKWRPRRFGVESVAQQRLYVDSLIRQGRDNSQRILIVPVQTSTHSRKEDRIRQAIDVELSHRRLFVDPKHTALIDEIKGFPATPTVDLVDALAMALELLAPLANSNEIIYTNNTNEVNKERLKTYAPGIRFS